MQLSSPALSGSPQRECFGHILRAALAAVEPEAATRRQLGWLGRDSIRIGSVLLPTPRSVSLLSVGKAALPMARGALQALEGRVERVLVVAPERAEIEFDGAFDCIVAEHPLPGAGSLRAGSAAKQLAGSLGEGDLLLACISGGSSSMLFAPRGASAQAIARATNTCMRAGLPIERLNRVRAALDELKFGGLAHLAVPADCGALILSDVPGDDMDLVGSGPTRRRDNPSMRPQLEALGIWDTFDEAVQAELALDHGGYPRAKRAPFDLLVAANADARKAAGDRAAAAGYEVISLGNTLQGEARGAGARFVSACDEPSTRALAPGRRCVIAGGETTVRRTGEGRGGRTLEFGYGVAQAIAGRPNVSVVCFTTDGLDGNSGAAGVVVDGTTLERAASGGVDLHGAAEDNDLGPAFAALGDLIITGATGTNVCDLALWLED